MTRVNCVPVEELCNSHLLAEYREMLRFRHAKAKVSDIPDSYRMGKGHVKFFYDKGKYLLNRHKELKDELTRRGISNNLSLDLSSWSGRQMKNWEPSEKDMLINRARIHERIVGMIERGIKVEYK